jgi:putative flippase GtrA
MHSEKATVTLALSQRGLERREPFDLAAVGAALVLGDPGLAERLVANLVDNAIRHNVTPGWITVATHAGQGHAILAVTNSGPVIPSATRRRPHHPGQLSPKRTSGVLARSGTVICGEMAGTPRSPRTPMMPTSRIVAALSELLPAPLRRWLLSQTGKRFARFVPVAFASFAATQIVLFVLVLAHLSAGVSGFIGAVVGAAVSYVLSRWAWERKGKPTVLTEIVPFWLVSIGAWIVLALAAHYGGVWASSMGAVGLKRAAIINGVTGAANCLTFLVRFLIIHYILFTDRGAGEFPEGGTGEPGDDRNPASLGRPASGQP